MICKDCKKPFDDGDHGLGDETQCVICWEAQCSDSWWALMKRLDEQFGPVDDDDALELGLRFH